MEDCPCKMCLILPLCKANTKSSLSYIKKVKKCDLLFNFLLCINVEPTCLYWDHTKVSEEEALKRLEASREILYYEPELRLNF